MSIGLNYPDGVYILHETLGVRGVESCNPVNDEIHENVVKEVSEK